jgi:hypothetical protein
MSADKNKQIVQQAKSILEAQGYKVKTGHLYELFSQLAGEKSWNVASSKQTNFERVLTFFKEMVPKAPEVNHKLTLKDLEKLVKSGQLKDEFFLGQMAATGEVLAKNFFVEPNALFTGSMGSGKTVALTLSISTWMLTNGNNTQLFIVDLLKGASDYQHLFNLKQVHKGIDTKEKLVNLIDMLYEEALARKDELNKVKAENVKDYEQKTGKKLPRCVVVIEEFHALPSDTLNFEAEYKTPGSPANKLHQLFRIGRSYGIWFLVASQKATKTDIPATLIANMVSKLAFRISKAESMYLLGTPEAGNLTAQERGMAITDWGKVMFSYWSPEELKPLLDQYVQSQEIEGLVITTALIEIKLKN